ncbi:helix-turn-helix domain-containing protein [Planomonospora venezuelensis]|uniref:Transcriptional regulator with XRE-family HTH domain n=1 Tax=Planomonospora venezuelensis TaxID=1999 RepID=A0A841D9N1_PLAVE|nr:helix-turn-helix transcriptional regulator [Planomonospora venezuelensis]MBB5966199.1 transcriptional regulator with XRE-family HTH domain [Planomonospora venezuelensis]GIN05174.1 hypothetical protein Pve01_68320 [Planomonospora venezuelensis]
MADTNTPQAIWGRELRHYRQQEGLTQAQLALKIHFSEGLISGVETGQMPASPEFAAACDKVLPTGGALVRLLDWRKGQVFPFWMGRWRDREQAAVALRSYQPLVMSIPRKRGDGPMPQRPSPGPLTLASSRSSDARM